MPKLECKRTKKCIGKPLVKQSEVEYLGADGKPFKIVTWRCQVCRQNYAERVGEGKPVTSDEAYAKAHPDLVTYVPIEEEVKPSGKQPVRVEVTKEPAK